MVDQLGLDRIVSNAGSVTVEEETPVHPHRRVLSLGTLVFKWE